MSNGRPLPDDLLSAWRDGELSGAEREEVARLLEESADARAEWEDYQALADVLRSLPDEKAPDGLRAAVMRRIERESLLAAAPGPARPARRPGRRFWIVGTLLAGSAAGLLVAFNAMRDGGGRPREGMVASSPAPDGVTRSLGRPSGGVTGAEFGRSGLAGAESATGRSSAETEDRLGETRFGMADSARPPFGAQPGDSYSYAEVSDDGQVMVVEATVVDVDLALNRLQYLLAKNSIEPQTVALDDFARSPAANSATNGEFGVYVVSDPAQIQAALEEANQQPSVFRNVQIAGVFNTRGVAEREEMSPDAAGNRVDGTDRRAFTRDTVAEQLRDRDAVVDTPVLNRARASLPTERFMEAAPGQAAAANSEDLAPPAQTARSEIGKEVEAIVAPKPAAATALADTAAVADKEGALGYQQVVNVSRAAIDEQLRQGQESLTRQNWAAGVSGGEGLGVQSNSFFVLPEQRPGLVGDLRAQLSTEQKAQADKARQKVRLLVLLQAEPAEAPKAEAGASFQPPVEAPQPAGE